MHENLQTVLSTMFQIYGDKINADILLKELVINKCLHNNESDIVLAEKMSIGKLIEINRLLASKDAEIFKVLLKIFIKYEWKEIYDFIVKELTALNLHQLIVAESDFKIETAATQKINENRSHRQQEENDDLNSVMHLEMRSTPAKSNWFF